MALPASSSGLFRFLSPRSRPQSTDIAAAATWGVFAGTAAIYLVQVGKRAHMFVTFNALCSIAEDPVRPELPKSVLPFDWIKKTFFEKPEPEA